jgi:hypothetical protein
MEDSMEENTYRSWKEFTQHEYRRVGTIQLSIDDLERDLFFEEFDEDDEDEEVAELDFG